MPYEFLIHDVDGLPLTELKRDYLKCVQAALNILIAYRRTKFLLLFCSVPNAIHVWCVESLF